MNRLPFDTYTFRKIIETKCVYVDKTDLVYKLANEVSIAFLSRPRRFGKSMLCTTLKEYFLGSKELFANLKIEKLEQNWTKYPVFSFTMSSLKDVDFELMESKLLNQIEKYEKIYSKNISKKIFSSLIYRFL